MRKTGVIASTAGLRHLVSAAFLLTCAVLVLGTAHAALPTDTAIDQIPLTASRSVAPNILLMMDDSGSMAWDYMPDYSNVVGHGGGLYDSRYNGVYYNPDVVYTPPPTASGGTYPNSPGLTQAYENGFLDQSLKNVVREGNYVGNWFWYGTWLKTADEPTQPVNWSCRGGYQQVPGDPTHCTPISPPAAQIPWTWVCPGGWSGPDSTLPTPQCSYTDNTGEKPVTSTQNAQHGCQANYTYDSTNDVCNAQLTVGANAWCPAGSGAPATPGTVWTNRQYGWNGVDTCYYSDWIAVFQYYNPDSPYGWRFVAKAGECASVMDPGQKAACSDEDDEGNGTNGAPSGTTVGQNVANWFSYYRTRILTAKTGLMKALAGMPTDTRFGFGSINGRGVGNIPSPTFTYNSGATGKTNSIAEVQPFGNGGSGTQRANFWTWLAGLTPGGETPLREALNETGQYYETQQPWQDNDGSSTSMDELACRQSYTILTTDGFWNGPAQTDPTGIGGNVDNTKGPKISGPNQPDYTYNPAPPFSDGYSGTLADIAQYYWENDLQPTIPNEVPPGLEDPAFWQHMGLFTLGMGFQPSGLQGTVSNGAGGTRPVTVPDIFKWMTSPSAAVTGFQWPQPSTDPNGQGNINNIADLVHAAVNGHGGYYSALDPASFTAGIQGALQRIQQRAGTGASFAANGPVLQLGSTTYQTMYATGKWNGDLRAYPVDPTTGRLPNAPAVTPTTPWSAAAEMPDWDKRNVWTYNPSPSANTPFFQIAAASASQVTTTLGELSSDQKTDLASRIANPSAAPSQTAIDTEAGNMIQYLLGDHALEASNSGGVYRTRDGILGDIVNSTPVYVGAPNAGANPSDAGYQSFVSTNKGRTPMVWVAANDGMLHAFDATSGKEKFAFLPGSVITANIAGAAWSGIANYADPNYGGSNPHEYFNDGRIAVADADVAAPNVTSNPDAAWRTVLVATTGRGAARAVYALDVTNPASPKLMWERSADDGLPGSNYIGQNISTPVIAQTANGWQVFMGNGYNSNNDQAALLQFSLSDGDLSVYTTDAQTANGLAPPVIWVGGAADGNGTTAYAGDLLGRVWSFDLTKSTPGAGTKLFTAEDADGTPQPITAGMLAGRGPGNTQYSGAVWVFFGTGKYLTSSDINDMSTQTWYGLIVQPALGQDASVVSNLANGRTALVQRFINSIPGDTAAQPPRPATRVVTDGNQALADKSGWYIDLQPSGDSVPHGERIVVANQFQSGWLLATTQLPEHTNLCNPSGTGWVMAINPFTGANPGSIFFDLDGDDRFTSNDRVTLNGKTYAAAGVHFDAIPNAPVFVGSRMLNTLDNAARSNINTAGPSTFGLVAWRELVTNN